MPLHRVAQLLFCPNGDHCGRRGNAIADEDLCVVQAVEDVGISSV